MPNPSDFQDDHRTPSFQGARGFSDSGKLFTSEASGFGEVDPTAMSVFAPTESLEGRTIFNAYKIISHLGAGEMATVYKAQDLKTGRMVAVKTLKYQDPELAARFAREVNIHSKLRHPNIVEAIACLGKAEQGETFFVMELIEGESLEQYLTKKSRIESVDDIASILSQLCDCLEYAHKEGVVHRDLKPENIIFELHSGRIIIKVLDFGLAKIQDSLQKLTKTGIVLGSPAYMSPEQCMGEPVDGRSDIYSLGVVAFDLIAGDIPYDVDNQVEMMKAHCDSNTIPLHLSDFRPNLPAVDQLHEILARAMEKDPDDRYQTLNQMKKDLDGWWKIATTAVPGTISPFRFVEVEDTPATEPDDAKKNPRADAGALGDLVAKQINAKTESIVDKFDKARPAKKPIQINKTAIIIAVLVLIVVATIPIGVSVVLDIQEKQRTAEKKQADRKLREARAEQEKPKKKGNRRRVVAPGWVEPTDK